MSLEEEDKKNNKKNKNEEITVTYFRGSPKVIQISKGNYYYLINREKYDITKIMMMINYTRLSTLGFKFRAYHGGIEKIKFATLLTNILKTEKMPVNELTDLIYGIYKFFNEIDYNGDNNMEWAEFTQFIIDKVEGEHNNLEIEQDNTLKQAIPEKELIKYKRYELSKNIKDIHVHKTEIISSFFINKNNKLLISEYSAHVIKVYNPLLGKIENIINIYEIKEQSNEMKYEDNQKHNFSSSNKKYTIINFYANESIIAVLLSNKLIQFYRTFNFKENDIIFCLKAKSLQKRIWYLEHHNMWITSGDKENEEDYYYINELDINFEMKSGFPIPLTNFSIYKNKYCKISKHRDEIYDVIETKKPFLILTACLDGLIRLINVKDLDFIKTWNYHSSGVKHLDYNPNLESNGYILSTGFEYTINIYCTDLSLDSAFKGKLEGHFVPLIDCKFINNTPICASVDEDGNIRIWETQQKICLQSIPNMKKNILVNGMVIMGKLNKLVTFGNNITFYDAKYKEQKENFIDNNEENHPIKICYNKYYQQFYVISLNDIKIYDKYGNLDKKYKKLIENEHFDAGTKIRDFVFDCNYRKFYIGFSNGAIIQYNAGNSSAIKTINQIEYERNGILYYKYHHNKDISSLYYYYSKRDMDSETILLFSSSLDSTIQVYDERDYDTSIILKMYKGGHTLNRRRCEIFCMDYNYDLSQLASGSANGLIVIWDFENMKIDDTLYINYKIWGMKIDVIYLKYLNSFPLLLAGYSEGINILWTVKPMKGEAILKFQNFYQTSFKLDICDISCCCFYEDLLDNVNETYLNKIYFVDEPEFIEERSKPRYDKNNGELLPSINRNTVEKESIIDKRLDPFYKEDKNNKGDANDINNEKENSMKDNENNDNKKEIKDNDDNIFSGHNYYLLICDTKGFMKILNLNGVFRHFLKNYVKKYEPNSNFNILKKEKVDVEPTITHLLKNSRIRQTNVYDLPFMNLYATNIINREWKGHLDYITSVELVEDPISTITVSKDKFLRIWNGQFELIGEINVVQDENININKNIMEKKVEWKFRVNEKKLLEKEANEIVYILENIDIDEDTKIIRGSEIDKDFNNPEKYEIDEKEGLIKKREKTIKEEEEKKIVKQKFELKNETNENVNKDDNNYQSNYEAILLKNISTKIETIIKNKPENEGMGELSSNIMTYLIDKKYKNKNKNNLHFFNINKAKTLIVKDKNDIRKDGSRRPSIISIKKSVFNRSQSKTNIIGSDNPDGDFTPKSNIHSIFKFEDNGRKSMFDIHKSNTKTLMKFKDKNLSLKKKITNKTSYGSFTNKNHTNISFKKIKIISNPKNRVASTTNHNFNNNTISRISTLVLDKRTASVHKTTFSLNRNNLYAEKFVSKPLGKEKEEDEQKKNILPNIRSKYFSTNNIKLNNLNGRLNYEVREKTDDLIKTQYYLNNYKNCCKINPNNSDFSTNKSNMFNCKNMWKDILTFTKDIKEKEKKHKKTRNNKSNFKIIFKSKSVSNMLNDQREY